MATITKVCRKTGDAYKAVIRLRGIKPFSKTFKRKTDARAWAERMERDIEDAHAHGNALVRNLKLGRLIQEYILSRPGQDRTDVSNLYWWKQRYGEISITPFSWFLVLIAAPNARHYTSLLSLTDIKAGALHVFAGYMPCSVGRHRYYQAL